MRCGTHAAGQRWDQNNFMEEIKFCFQSPVLSVWKNFDQKQECIHNSPRGNSHTHRKIQAMNVLNNVNTSLNKKERPEMAEMRDDGKNKRIEKNWKRCKFRQVKWPKLFFNVNPNISHNKANRNINMHLQSHTHTQCSMIRKSFEYNESYRLGCV